MSSAESPELRFCGAAARPGDVIAARYAVIGQLGAGGMGQVLEVEHLELEKRFALKLIRPDRWDDVLEARFRREAKSLARVVSPRVAQVTDFGVDPDRGPFYVMELVEGETLSDLIAREGALPRSRALTLARGVAAALADVHEVGIVHRDVKPGNIGVSARGPVEVRLLDFGLATSTDERFGSKITESHRVVGSFPYMSPEQFHGETPSPRVDVWALGIVLYEMLTGRLPFDAPSTAALIHQVLSQEVPMEEPAPRTCARAFDGLLAKDPSARPADAAEALTLLEEVLANPSTDEREATAATAEATRVETAAPTRTPQRKLAMLGITLGLVGVLAIAASVLLLQDGEPAEPAVAPSETPLAAPADAPVEPPVEVVETPAPAAPPLEMPVLEPPPARPSEPEAPAEAPPPSRRASRPIERPRPQPPVEPAESEPATPVAPTPLDDGPLEVRAWDGTIIELTP